MLQLRVVGLGPLAAVLQLLVQVVALEWVELPEEQALVVESQVLLAGLVAEGFGNDWCFGDYWYFRYSRCLSNDWCIVSWGCTGVAQLQAGVQVLPPQVVGCGLGYTCFVASTKGS